MTFGDNSGLMVRKAKLADLDEIKLLVDQHKLELGFVVRAALMRSINSSEVMVAISENEKIVGFVHYRHRKDGQTTLYNILVRHDFQGHGVGERLVAELAKEAVVRSQKMILLKCPVELKANDFYRKLGFTLEGTLDGKKRPLNVWRIDI